MFLWRYRRPSGTNIKKRCPFHHRGLKCKSRKSRDTWNNKQVWPWSTEWSRAKGNRVLPTECTGHSKHLLPTTQEATLHMDITQTVNTKIRLIIFFATEDGEALHSQQKQDWKLTVAHFRSWTPYAKFRLILKKVGKTTRPFRCDLNQIPYGYRMEETNRFNYQIRSNRVPNELWNDVHDIVQETGIKTILMEKKCKRAKWLSGEALQIAVKEEKRKAKI